MVLNSTGKILLLFALVSCIGSACCQTLQNPVFWQAPRLFNASDSAAGSIPLDNSAQYAFSEDFQTVYAGGDADNLQRRLLIDFSFSCNSTDTTFERLQQLNKNSLDHPFVQRSEKIALIQRGRCNWSEKIQLVMNISSANSLNVSAAILYDNTTRQDAAYVTVPFPGFKGVGSYDSTLPSDRNISSMSDNDLSGAPLRIPVYFVPKSYGDSLLNASNTDPMYPGYTEFMQLCAYLDKAWFTNGNNNPSVWVISRGYLSYIIALAAVFLIALFAGIIFLRWWRVRQLREQREYEAQLGEHAYNMQLRGRQAKPLPVDIVNSFPIETYTVDRVKNANCAICLDDFAENSTEVRILGCGHGFCVLCIDPWLTQKSTVCPMCKYDCLPPERRRLEEEQEAAEASESGAGASTLRSTGGSNRSLQGTSSEAQEFPLGVAATNNYIAEQPVSEIPQSSTSRDQPVVINLSANENPATTQTSATPANASAAAANNAEHSSITKCENGNGAKNSDNQEAR